MGSPTAVARSLLACTRYIKLTEVHPSPAPPPPWGETDIQHSGMRKEEGGGGRMQIVLEWMQPRCSCVCFRMLLSALFLFLHLHVNRKYKHLLLPGIGYQQDKVAKQVASCTYITAPAVQPGEECQRWAAAYAPEVCCRSHSAKELFGNFPPRTRGQLCAV